MLSRLWPMLGTSRSMHRKRAPKPTHSTTLGQHDSCSLPNLPPPNETVETTGSWYLCWGIESFQAALTTSKQNNPQKSGLQNLTRPHRPMRNGFRNHPQQHLWQGVGTKAHGHGSKTKPPEKPPVLALSMYQGATHFGG